VCVQVARLMPDSLHRERPSVPNFANPAICTHTALQRAWATSLSPEKDYVAKVMTPWGA